jgi:NHL repeat
MRATLALALAATALLVGAGGPTARAAPVVLDVASHLGWGVDASTDGNVCTVASGDDCHSGSQSSGPGGFGYPRSVAFDPQNGNLYVADTANDRLQELTGAGAFVSAFGWDVNETEDRLASASQSQRDICTAASADACTDGGTGVAAGQLAGPESVAVDPRSGDLYVLEIATGDFRVEKYTATGRFVWRIGGQVNGTTKANLCTAQELQRLGVSCQAGVESPPGATESGAFKFPQSEGDLLAAGGPEDLLYVGDEHRVQEFDADGHWRGEILLASLSAQPESDVMALALDGDGDLYLVYRSFVLQEGERVAYANVIHEFDPHGEQLAEFPVNARQPGANAEIDGLALAPSGLLAVIGDEDTASSFTRLGLLYSARTGRPEGGFTPPSDNDGIAFDSDEDLYVAATDDQEVVAYIPGPPTELLATLRGCEVGAARETLAALDCALDSDT